MSRVVITPATLFELNRRLQDHPCPACATVNVLEMRPGLPRIRTTPEGKHLHRVWCSSCGPIWLNLENLEWAPTVGERLRSWRYAQTLTQTEAARQMGVAFRTYQDWERDVAEPQGYGRTVLARLLDQFEQKQACRNVATLLG